ncbi:MAG TPA: MepB family protein [Enterococcus aquimarinus]|nr:MepB family protein [Enterococcus aquimarinus]
MECQEGCLFSIDQHLFRNRLAKKTPKKKGYFVVFWEKDSQHHNHAYSFEESPDR